MVQSDENQGAGKGRPKHNVEELITCSHWTVGAKALNVKLSFHDLMDDETPAYVRVRSVQTCPLENINFKTQFSPLFDCLTLTVCRFLEELRPNT